jgi:multiple sugar transport system substrate-binding protein
VTASTHLNILCWDHPRCMQPMRAAVRAYGEARPEVKIMARTRPLAAFNDQPIEDAVGGCDLVVFDHPMVPRAAEVGALLPVDGPAPAVGASAQSYEWAGRGWGLAADAACQVAAARNDLLDGLDAEPPVTWDDALALARRHPDRVALPLTPSDALCALMSVSAAVTGPELPYDALHPQGVDVLAELVAHVDERCSTLAPPVLLDRLATTDDWAYVPLTFGYAHVAGVRWCDAPTLGHAPGSVLGGAGLGVVAETAARDEALRFARWYCEASTQRDVVLVHGGQPASQAVWDDPTADAVVGGFLTATRHTMDAARVRPRAPWWPRFQQCAGLTLHRMLVTRASATRIHRTLTELYERHASAEADAEAAELV